MSKAKSLMRNAFNQTDLYKTLHQDKQTEKEENQSEPMVVKQETKDIPTGVLQIRREDVDINVYGKKPVVTNFNCYNSEVFEFIRTFSSKNQFAGGVAITKSQLIETILDFVYYDLKLAPIGFDSIQELRKHLQEKVNK